MEKDTLHLYCAYPDDLLDKDAERACLQLLSPDELARNQAFMFDRLRREYATTHALARTALSLHSSIAPHELRFQAGSRGKPSLDPECGLPFNLSNSPGLVVCLVGKNGEVGVDVEPMARAQSIREIASTVFSPVEMTQLNALSADRQPQRCLQLWTLKEAYIKARGMGLGLPLSRFSFIYEEPKNIRLQLDPVLNDDATRWRFCVLDYAEHSVALMVENTESPRLQFWEARPPFASPRSVDSVAALWHP